MWGDAIQKGEDEVKHLILRGDRICCARFAHTRQIGIEASPSRSCSKERLDISGNMSMVQRLAMEHKDRSPRAVLLIIERAVADLTLHTTSSSTHMCFILRQVYYTTQEAVRR